MEDIESVDTKFLNSLPEKVKPLYTLTHMNKDGVVEKSLFSKLKSARELGRVFYRKGTFISFKNKNGVDLPL